MIRKAIFLLLLSMMSVGKLVYNIFGDSSGLDLNSKPGKPTRLVVRIQRQALDHLLL